MKYFKIILVTAFLLQNASVFAGDSSSGCGLGWQVAPKNTLLSSTLRNTTHAFLPNTFSMTFGTSGCAHHDIVMNEKRGIYYAESNFHQLMIDMAQGEGEYLRGFAEVTGYRGDMKSYCDYLKQNYNKVFTSSDVTPVQMYENYKNLMTI